jgi:hypothetical protein
LLRKPKQLEVDLARAKAAGCEVLCRYSVAEAAALDENDPALFFCAMLPHGVEHLMRKFEYMSIGSTCHESHTHVRYC